MGVTSDLLYRKNRTRRKMVEDLVISIKGEIRFIERATNDTIERVSQILGVPPVIVVTSHGKTVYDFLQEVRLAYEELGRQAKERYGQALSAKVDTAVIENVRRKVLGLDLNTMREGVREFEIAGLTVDKAVTVVWSMVMANVTMDLERVTCMSVRVLGGLVSSSLVSALVFVIWEAIAGYAEGVEMEQRIKELIQAEETIRANSDAIVDCAEQLRDVLIRTQIMLGNVEDRKEFYSRYVLPLTVCSLPLLRA